VVDLSRLATQVHADLAVVAFEREAHQRAVLKLAELARRRADDCHDPASINACVDAVLAALERSLA
jgi:hypothetical protein